jgi:hypothetical protein
VWGLAGDTQRGNCLFKVSKNSIQVGQNSGHTLTQTKISKGSRNFSEFHFLSTQILRMRPKYQKFARVIEQYKGLITCNCFFFQKGQ